MKQKLFTLIFLGFEAVAHAQGAVTLDNSNNSSPSPTATSNGLFWISTAGTPTLITGDFNAAFYGGTDPSKLALLATFLLSNGTAAGDNFWGPGTFSDPTESPYSIPGASVSAFFQIQAWTGDFDSYPLAVAGGAAAAQSPAFVNPTSVPPAGPALFLTGMPAIVLEDSGTLSVCPRRTLRPVPSPVTPSGWARTGTYTG